jgi:repressor LexA
MPEPLSPRQQAVLDCIAAWTAMHGRPPTLREIAAELGLRQHSSAQAHVEALQRKGWLSRGSQHGSLRLLAPPPDGEQAASNDAAFLSLPLVGRVAAGAPILSEGHVEARYAIDPRLFRPRPHFLLRVEGDSMIGIGIHDGDLIAVHRTPDARDGQIVVARLEGEITVKRLRQRDGRLLLLAENPAYAPIEVDATCSDFAIEGLYVGAIRTR